MFATILVPMVRRGAVTAGLVVTLLAAVGPTSAWAVAHSWTGLGANDLWSTPENWRDSIVPPSSPSTSVIFTNSSRPTPYTDAPTTLEGLHFAVGTTPYTLSGTTLTLVNGAVSNSSSVNQTIANSEVVLTGSTGTFLTYNNSIIMSSAVSGTAALVKAGAQTLVLSGNNTYTGGTVINDGILEVRSASALGSTGTIIFDGGTLLYSDTDTDYSARLTATPDKQYRIDTNYNKVTFHSAIANPSGGMVVTGSPGGSLTLAADNAFNGFISVQSGKLIINGDNSANTDGVDVSDGELGGTGTIGHNVDIHDFGVLSPGNGAGTLNINGSLNIIFNGTALFEGNDLVNVTGLLDLDLDWTLKLASGFQDGGSMVLFNYGVYATGEDGLFPTFDISGLGFTPTGPLFLTDTGSSIVLNGVSAVPEPGTWALLALGLSTVLLARRRN